VGICSLATEDRADFAAEGAALEKNGFPELRSHKAEHKALAEQVLKFQKDFRDGKPGVAPAVMPFLAEVAARSPLADGQEIRTISE
jgi:hemerythrin